jgi:aspartate aminotransferase
MKLAKRSAIPPSLTLAMNAKAKKLQSEGVNVISFAAGEPDFPTPGYIREAGKQAIDQNKTYYTPASGITELKQAVARKLKRENGLEYTEQEIVINAGAKHSVFNALAVLVEEGDEVIIPAPYWVSYSEMVSICGAAPVFIAATEDTGFKITPEQLRGALSPRTRVLLLNSPCNPTGAVYSEQELSALAGVMEEHEAVIISDEIYEKILYDGNRHVSIAALSPSVKEKTLVVNGMSKAFSMTGWRIGYTAGPSPVIQAVSKLQGHTTGNPSSIAQWASLAGLSGDTGFIGRWNEEFARRRDFFVSELNAVPGVTCSTPGGAFYVFPNVSGLMGRTLAGRKVRDSVDLADFLLEEAKIAAVPGKAFGAEGYLRFSFATSMDNIVEGMKRMKKALG